MFGRCRTYTMEPPITMNASVAQLNDSQPVAVKRRYPSSAPMTEASEPTDTIRVSARAIAKNATALAHAGVATKSRAPKPAATLKQRRPAVAGDRGHSGERLGEVTRVAVDGEQELREEHGDGALQDVE